MIFLSLKPTVYHKVGEPLRLFLEKHE
jgi:hypothetical protein